MHVYQPCDHPRIHFVMGLYNRMGYGGDTEPLPEARQRSRGHISHPKPPQPRRLVRFTELQDVSWTPKDAPPSVWSRARTTPLLTHRRSLARYFERLCASEMCALNHDF